MALLPFGSAPPLKLSELDSRYLLLDQTTPQSILSGAPIFDGGLKTGIINAKDANGLSLFDDGGSGIFVKDGGKVGIGTTAPTQKLDVASSGNTRIRLATSGSTSLSQLIQYSDSYWSGLTLNSSGATGTTAGISNAGLAALQSYAANLLITTALPNSNIIFAPTNNESLRITSTGSVGIGTTTPGAKLQINADASGIGQIIRANATTPGNMSEWQDGSGNLRAWINSTGSIGLRRQSSGGPLLKDVGGSGNSTLGIRNSTDTADGNFYTDAVAFGESYQGIGIKNNLAINWASGSGVSGSKKDVGIKRIGTNSLQITDGSTGYGKLIAGTVGIGTTSPGAQLHLKTASVGIAYQLYLQNEETNNYTGVLFSRTYSAYAKGGLIYGGGGSYGRGDFYFLQDQTTDSGTTPDLTDAVFTIKNSGNVGIGTTSPSTKLDIGAGAMTLEAMTAPSSPASDKAVLFLEATGTSPSRTVALKVKWQDGSTSTLASVTV